MNRKEKEIQTKIDAEKFKAKTTLIALGIHQALVNVNGGDW